ncbi:MAG: hypothetical protein OXT67_07695 [Zetaproteobacteria bacterium]|nr:hypothetical protein [Zetaproteobacteria bacterium]
MTKIAQLHVICGFFFIFSAACAGAFLANDLTQAFAQRNSILGTWTYTLLISAHSHTNQFGILHILFGLTYHWNALSPLWKLLQFIGMCLGSLAMSIFMVLRASTPPHMDWDILGLATGLCLSAALAAIGSHIFGLCLQMHSRH